MNNDAPFVAVQPPHWAGMQKGGPGSPMVCGACPDWEKCGRQGFCDRATPEDYEYPAAPISRPLP